MGGGTMWRGVARVVSPAVRVGAASTSTSCSFCKKVGTSAQAAKAHSSSARFRSCACTSATGTAAQKTSSASVSQQQQGAAALWEADEWEFAEEEEKVDHLVFGSLPSKTEIEEASSELQNALRLGLVAQAASDQAALGQASRAFSPAMIGGQSGESSSVGKEMIQASNPNVLATQMALDWVEPPSIRTGQGVLQGGRRDNVVDAFRQFQHNPEVRSMVNSLATDPAIWDAVLANEKIQEFKRRMQKEKDMSSEGSDSTFANVKSAEVKIEEVVEIGESSPSIFIRWQSFWQRKISLFMAVLSNIIDGLFKGADRKVFAEEDGDIIDRTVKSCTMLALVVLCVVILKRLAVQAA